MNNIFEKIINTEDFITSLLNAFNMELEQEHKFVLFDVIDFLAKKRKSS